MHKIHTKGTKIFSFAATQLKAASYGTFSHTFCFILKSMTCFRASLNVALEWYITFLTKQWCKALKEGHGISEREGPEATVSLSFPNIHPWACNLSCWQSTCDENETKFDFFTLGLQIPHISYCIFEKPMICTNLITYSAKLCLYEAERGQ